jgi:hypothetical protein
VVNFLGYQKRPRALAVIAASIIRSARAIETAHRKMARNSPLADL